MAMVVRQVVEASRAPYGGPAENIRIEVSDIRIEVSVDFDGAARMSAQAAEGVVRESVVDIAERMFYGRDERG